MPLTQSTAALTPEIWKKVLFKDVIRDQYFMQSGLMGEGENNIIQVDTSLTKNQGDRVTIPLSTRIGPTSGVAGDNELEGNESQIDYFSDSIIIDQWRDAVRVKGALDEQKMAIPMRPDAKDKLQVRLMEFMEIKFFMALGGVQNTSLTDVNGENIGYWANWSNSPTIIPNADTNAGFGDRYLCADFTNGATSLVSTDKLTPSLIRRAKRKAQLANPKIRPVRINGRNYYVLMIHPWQAFDLKENAEWAQAQREAERRGPENPIFTDALGIIDGVIIKEHEFVPYLDVSVAGNNFGSADSGTDFSVDTCRALLLGAQAGYFGKSKFDPKGWVEKMFDYDNQWGVATQLIGGIDKVMFNSKEYAVIAVDTAVTVLN